MGYSPWGCWELDMTERLHFLFSLHALEKEMATHSSFLPGEFQGQGSLVGCRLWGRTESDTTERLHFTSVLINQQDSPGWFSGKESTCGAGDMG